MRSVGVIEEVLLCELVAGQNVERVPIDLHVAAQAQVSWRDECAAFIYVLVLAALKELALYDARVLLSGLVNGHRVVREEEGYNEPAFDVFWDPRVEAGCESQNLAFVVNCLEEVFLRLFWQQLEDVAQRVDFITEAVVRRNLLLRGFWWLGVLNLANVELFAELLSVEVSSEGVHTLDVELAAE